MTETLLSYLIYNVMVGIVLTIVHLVQTKGPKEPRILLWLLFFPSVGLGYWRYAQAKQSAEKPALPENWYMWKNMVKVNWGFMAILLIGPLVLIALSTLGILAGGTLNMESFGMMTMDEIKGMIGASLVMLGLLYVIIMFFVLIIPFLLLIVLPKSQANSIERQYILAQKRAQTAPAPTPKPVAKSVQLFQDVHIYVLSCLHEFNSISSSRKKELEDVARYVSQKLKQQETVNLIFICTHNSRRSQLSQVWAAVAAANYGVRNVHCFSGGTEETSFAKRAVETLKQAGLKIDGTVGTNPRYTVRYSDEVGALDCFSKKYDHAANPQKGFAALMTCSDADVNCPFVPGAEVRYKLTYEDPKLSDRTPQEAEIYEGRNKQIATEMLYLFSHVS